MDIFTCGVCQLELHSIKDFYEHKVKYSECHQCRLCDGVKFHHKDQLLSHHDDVHGQVQEKVDGSDSSTQVNLLVTGDSSGNIVLDTAILEKLFEISSQDAHDDGSGIRNNVHIIVKEGDGETKVDDAVELVYMPTSSSSIDEQAAEVEIDKDGDSDKEISSPSDNLQDKIYICKLCNHFSYRKSGVFAHLVQVHQKCFDLDSSEVEDYVQELGLLPIADEADVSIHHLIHGEHEGRRTTSKHSKSGRANQSGSSKGLSRNMAQHYFCANCSSDFSQYKAFKNHICSYDEAMSDESNDSMDDQEMEDAENQKQSIRRMEITRSKRPIVGLKKSKSSSVKSETKLKTVRSTVEEAVHWDESKKAEWEKIELEKEIVFSCVDHLYTELEEEEMDESSTIVDKAMENITYKCNVCRKMMPTLLDIRTHCLTHTNLKPYRCTKCKYATKVKSLLMKHFNRHPSKHDVETSERVEEEKSSEYYKCDLCLDQFDSMITLVIHIRRNHKTSEKGLNLLLALACEKVKRGEEDGFRCFFCYDNFEKEDECLEHVKSLHLRNQAITNISRIDSSMKTWKCHLCSHTTNYAKPFLKHITKHKLIFSCCVCHLKILSVMQLKRHLEEEHIKCEGELKLAKVHEMTQRSMNDSWYLPEETTKRLNAIIIKACHKLRVSDDSNIMKIIGILKYKRLSPQIYQHIKQTLGSVECHHCGRLFFSPAELKRHDGIHAIDKQHKCNKCDYSAATKDNLSRHIAKIHEKKVLSCPDCNYTTLCQTTMWKHKKSHQQKLECTECHKQFDKLKQLRQHMIECHLDNNIKLVDETGNVIKKSVANSSFKCPHCSRQFHRSIQEFKRHMWIHEGIKPIKCKQCSYRCRTSNHLEVHMRKHSSLKPHQCPHCYKDFKSKGSLQYHMQRFHSDGQKTLFACDKCDYTTAQKGHLKLHLRNHLVIRNFSCHLCFYSSNTLSSLKGHYKKKHKGMEFTAVNDEGNNSVVRLLSSHEGDQLTNEGEPSAPREEIRVFKCDTCDYRFTNITDFRRHLKIKHGLVNFKWNEVEVKVLQ